MDILWLQDISGDEILGVTKDAFLVGKLWAGKGSFFVPFRYIPNTGVFEQIEGNFSHEELAKQALIDDYFRHTPQTPPKIKPHPLKWLVVGADHNGYFTWQWCQTKQEILEFVGERGIKIVATCEGVPVNTTITVDISPIDDAK